MAGYILVDIEVLDPVRYEDYKRLASSSIQAHQGRYLIRGGAVEVLDGDWKPNRFVMLEFETVEKAKAWRDSPEYAEARKIRDSCARANMIVVEGLE